MDEWAERRRDAAAERAELLARRRRAETDRAGAMLRTFAGAARRAGLPPEPLRVQDHGGRGTARTDLAGWYLRGDRTAAVGTDGQFYVLTGRLTVLDRLRGTTATPQKPPLVLGAGGKDGDSVELSTALTRLLPGWDD